MADAPRLPQVIAVRAEGAAVEIDLAVTADIVWFEGHFPDLPVLAGVVQIEWALDLARRHLGVGTVSARQFQIKFKQMIVPGDMVTLMLRHDLAKHKLKFEYRCGGQVCTVGSVVVA